MRVKDANAFIRGQRDCKNGLAAQSTDPDYSRGYATQYAAEQALLWQTEQKEKAYEQRSIK